MSWLRIVVSGVLAGLIGSAASPVGARAVSYAGERELGARFDMMARQTLPLVRDPEFVSYVDEIGQTIVGGLDDSFFDYRFSVVRDDSINAFAVPGGYVYVNIGLIVRAENDDEIAAVLGHEIAHVHAHHMVRQQEKTQLLSYATLLATLAGVVQPGLAQVAAAAGQAATLKYRRAFEQEADYLGVRYLRKTDYDPRAMLDFFKKLEGQSRLTPLFFPPYLRAHPLTEERLNHLEAVLHAKQWEDHKRRRTSRRLQRLQALARARYLKPQDAVDQYAKLLAANRGSGQANYLYGVVALEAGRLEDARAALEKARQLGIVDSGRELGRVALRQRRPPDAIALLRAYLKRQPDDAMASVELAKALEVAGDKDAARGAYRRALESFPQLDVAHEGYGLLAGRAGDTGDGFYHLGIAAQLRGEYGKALEQLRHAVGLFDEHDARRTNAEAEIAKLEEYLDVDPVAKED